MLSLKGKVAIVTGAGSVGPGWGNGKATAVLLARQGAKVFGLDNNAAAVEETISIIKSEGGEATAHICDVLDSESFQAAVEACVAHYGQLDITTLRRIAASELGVARQELDRILRARGA